MATHSLPSAALATGVLLTIAACTPAVTPTVLNTAFSIPETAVADQLGDQLVFADRMGTAQLAPLLAPLDVDGTPATRLETGDVAYWPKGLRIVVFLSEGAAVPGDELVVIGHVSEGLDDFLGCDRKCVVNLGGADR